LDLLIQVYEKKTKGKTVDKRSSLDVFTNGANAFRSGLPTVRGVVVEQRRLTHDSALKIVEGMARLPEVTSTTLPTAQSFADLFVNVQKNILQVETNRLYRLVQIKVPVESSCTSKKCRVNPPVHQIQSRSSICAAYGSRPKVAGIKGKSAPNRRRLGRTAKKPHP